MTTRRDRLAEEYAPSRADLRRGVEREAFKAGYDARSKDVEKLLRALTDIRTTLSRAPVVNLDAQNGYELAKSALAEFEGESE